MTGNSKITLEAKITIEKIMPGEIVEKLNDEETIKKQLIDMLDYHAEPDKVDVEITNYSINLLN